MTTTVGNGFIPFEKVSTALKYVPMVSRDEQDAIYGIFSTPVRTVDLPIHAASANITEMPNYEDLSKPFVPTTPKDYRKSNSTSTRAHH
jgi:hypothetical protein